MSTTHQYDNKNSHISSIIYYGLPSDFFYIYITKVYIYVYIVYTCTETSIIITIIPNVAPLSLIYICWRSLTKTGTKAVVIIRFWHFTILAVSSVDRGDGVLVGIKIIIFSKNIYYSLYHGTSHVTIIHLTITYI